MAKIRKLPIKDEKLPLITDNKETPDGDRGLELDLSSIGNVSAASKRFIKNIQLYEEMMELFPDLELSGEIHVSSILNPNDAIGIHIKVNTETDKISPDALIDMNSIVEAEIKNYYKLDKQSYTMLWERNVTYGAYCVLVLNNASITNYIDHAFRRGVERSLSGESYSLKDLMSDMGITDNPISVTSGGVNAGESTYTDLLTFTDDPTILLGKSTFDKVGEAVKNKDTSKFWIDSLFRDLSYINTEEQSSIIPINEVSPMRPLYKRIPPEAIIPIVKKSDPSTHLDYLILLDGYGEPITHINAEALISEEKDPAEMEILLPGKPSTGSILKKAKNMQSIMSEKTPNVTIDRKIIEQSIDAEIRRKFKERHDIELLDSKFMERVMDVMLSRVLAKQRTKVLYVRKENLSYMARRYDRNGMGRSILDQLYYNTSLRALLETSSISAQIQNNIPRKKYTVTLDADDQNPDKTKSMVMESILNSEQSILPTGLLSVPDLSKWVGSIGTIIEVKHPKYPDMTIEYDISTRNNPTPDNGVFEKLTEKVAMKFGITPEMLENGRSADFAITEIYKNSLQAKRMLREQEKYEMDMSSHIGRLIANDGIIKEKLSNRLKLEVERIKKVLSEKSYIGEITDEKILDALLNEYIQATSISYPKPDTISDGVIKDKYEDFVNVAKDFLDLRLSADSIPEEIFKEFSTSIDDIKDMIVGVLATRWMKRNNYMPELVSMFSSRDGKDHGDLIATLFSEHRSFIINVEDSLLAYLKSIKKENNRNLDKLTKLNSDEEEEENETVEQNNGNEGQEG